MQVLSSGPRTCPTSHMHLYTPSILAHLYEQTIDVGHDVSTAVKYIDSILRNEYILNVIESLQWLSSKTLL